MESTFPNFALICLRVEDNVEGLTSAGRAKKLQVLQSKNINYIFHEDLISDQKFSS